MKRAIEARSSNHRCREKAISITYSERVCSLRYPARKAHAPYYIVASLALPYFSTLSYKRHDFRVGVGEEVAEHKMCVLIFSTTLSGTFLILGKNELYMIKNVYWS